MRINLKTKTAICVLVAIVSLLLLVFCGMAMVGGDFFNWVGRGFHYVYTFLFDRPFDIKTGIVLAVVLITLAALIYWLNVAIKSEKMQLYELVAPFTTVLMPFMILAAIRGKNLGVWNSDDKALAIIALIALIIYVIASCSTLFYSYKSMSKKMKAIKSTSKKNTKARITFSIIGVVILIGGIYWSVIEFVLKDYRYIDVIQFRYTIDADGNTEGTPAYITGIKEEGYPEVFELPKKLLGHPIVGIDAEAFKNLPRLQKVILPMTVEEIGDGAFSECPLLTDVVVNGELKTVGNDIFKNSGWLSAHSDEEFITFGNFLYKYNGNQTKDFILKSEKDKKIGENEDEYVYIPTEINKFASGAFSNQNHLVRVEMPEEYTVIEKSVFMNCSKLESVELNNVTSIQSEAFSGCTNLSSIELKNVTVLGSGAFKGTALETVTINEKITSINPSLFENCTSLSSIIIPNSVTSIGNDAFAGDISLKHISLSNNVTSIGNRAFKGSGIEEFTFPKYMDTVNNELFMDAKSLTKVVFPKVENGNTGIIAISNSAFKNTKSLTSIEFPKNDDGAETVKTIETSAFEGSGLKSVTIPKLVTSLSDATFKDCADLEEVNFYEDGGLTIIRDECFSGTTSLKKIVFPNTVNIFFNAILANSSISEVQLPANNRNFTTLNRGFFENCINLTHIDIPESVDTIDAGVFRGCINLESISLGGKVRKISEGTFENDKSLTSLVIPSSAQSIDANAFKNCTSLEEIIIPSSVTSIGDNAFENCTNLKTITFEENSKLKSIGANAFNGCTSLTSIILPSSVTTIKGKAFYGCDNLTIKCEAEEKPSNWDNEWNLLLLIEAQEDQEEVRQYVEVVWGYSVVE